MTEFRYSKKLKEQGIDYDAQGLIYFICINVRKMPTEIQRRILNLCTGIAGSEYQALYKFLTDSSVNHNYIQITYSIPPKLLFKWKREFYKKWNSEF